MIKNYFKTAFRNLQRNKRYAVINMLGLAIGIAACLLIFLVVRFETSFDNFHSKKNSIYRIGTEFHNQDGVSYSDGIAFPAAPGLRIDFPQLKEVASIFSQGGQITAQSDNGQLKKMTEDNFYYAEPAFFKMFDFEWLYGNPQTSLKEPNSAVLTRATAEKFFGNWRSAISKITNIFAGLAIFICCIGLAGLASFTIEKRIREIGIRKVLGASLQQLLMLISKEFLWLVLIAFLIAVPLTWWLMSNWLEKYVYRINISIWLFVGVGAVILMLTLLVVSLNTIRAAIRNPVKSLRTE